jgi:hypothetical protein
MLQYISTNFFPPDLQANLGDMELRDSISIRFLDYDWSFSMHVQEFSSPSTKSNSSVTFMQHQFAISKTHVVMVDEELTESKFTWSIPYQLLTMYEEKYREFQASNPEEYLRQYCSHHYNLRESLDIYRSYVRGESNYQGLTFRPSTYKKNLALQFIPINLHQHYSKFATRGFGQNAQASISITTFGAPAAHCLK